MAAGIVLGLGVLTKGPVVLALAALTIAIFLLFERRNPFAALKLRWPWLVLASAGAVAACWYVPWLAQGAARSG